MMSVRPATWLEGCEHKPAVLDAFCHALQSPEAAAVFSPSLWVCLLLLIWGITPDIESGIVPKNFFAGGILVFTHRLICSLQLSLVRALKKDMGRRKHVRLFLAHLQVICTRAPMCAGACACVCARALREERRIREREREREREKERESEREREGGREGGRRERDRKRERENVLERACGWVLLVEIQQVSEILLQDFWKVHACCRDNIFALLEGVSLFKVPYRSPQEITYV